MVGRPIDVQVETSDARLQAKEGAEALTDADRLKIRTKLEEAQSHLRRATGSISGLHLFIGK